MKFRSHEVFGYEAIKPKYFVYHMSKKIIYNQYFTKVLNITSILFAHFFIPYRNEYSIGEYGYS